MVLDRYIKLPKDVSEEERKETNIKYPCDDRWFSLIVDGTFAPIKISYITYKGYKGVGVTYQMAILADLPLSNIQLQENEKILADKGYIGPPSLLVPYIQDHDLTEQEKCHNYFIHKEKQPIEHSFCFLKYFKFLKLPWQSSLPKHLKAFIFICQLHNISKDVYKQLNNVPQPQLLQQ